MYQSTKTYGHEVGFSCAFRQWKAESHCRFLHGYSIAIKLVFQTYTLDDKGWCVDFGSLKSLKNWFETTFDHKTVVASNDPCIEWFKKGHELGLLDMVEVERTGCEAFAELIFGATEIWLIDNGYSPRVSLTSVEVKEHGANSAIYSRG